MAKTLAKALLGLKLPVSSDSGMTVREICVEVGRPPAWVRERLRVAIVHGEVKVGKRAITKIDGALWRTPVYYRVAEKNGKKAAKGK